MVFRYSKGLWASKFKGRITKLSRGEGLAGLTTNPQWLSILANEQEIFDNTTQAESFAYMHAMRMQGEDPAAARSKANSFVRENICLARKLITAGQPVAAMIHLSHAMHTLQDATSPAHANFQEAWPDTNWQIVKHSPHYYNEWFDPGPGSEADLATIRAWKYYTGELAMPADFFGNIYDLPGGNRGYFASRPSPDRTKCGC